MDEAPNMSATGTTPPLVELRQIDKAFNGVSVLRSAQLSVEAGEILGLVGENGAGKSTLVKILAGELRRDGGEICWLGKPTSLATRQDAEELGITMIHQELNLAPQLTVAQNLFLGHEPGHHNLLDQKQEERAAHAALNRLGFELDCRTPVSRLSPAQKQLVEIARAVVCTRRLVIMDEPTSSLSAREVAELSRVTRQLKMDGVAVIFVTHRLEELAALADRVVVLRDGQTVYEGAMPRRDFGELIQAMVGRKLRDFYPARSSSTGTVALEVKDLHRRRDSHARDLEGISFSLRHGETVGLAGLVGSGRSELVESIFGVIGLDGGNLLIDGQEASIRSPQDAVRLGITLLTEDRKRTGLAMNLCVAQNITLANLAALLRWGTLDLQREDRVATDFLDRLRIKAQSVHQKVTRLSGGNQQKVVLAKWLFRQGQIFIFDEPTRGIDVGAKMEIYHLMNRIVESGAAILMVSSDLSEILGMTDRVLVMRNGRVVKELTTSMTSQEEIIRYAALGE